MKGFILHAISLHLVLISVSAAAASNPCKDKLDARMEMALIASNISNFNNAQIIHDTRDKRFANIKCVDSSCSFDEDSSVVWVHEPNHPNANENGFVAYPKMDLMAEMENMIAASRRHDAAECSESARP